MPKKPLKDKEALVVVFDVGETVTKNSFFDRAKECLSLIIQRKLLTLSSDELCLVLMGCKEDHGATVISGYENIVCKFDLQPVSWNILRYVETELKPSGGESDWVDALIVSMELLRQSELTGMRIVLISDFSCAVSDDKVDIVARNIKKLGFEISIIGPDHFLEVIVAQYSEPSAKRQKFLEVDESGEKSNTSIIYNLWCTLGTSMQVCTFDLALRQLTVLPAKPVKKTCWNVTMDIGDVQINVSALVKVKVGGNPVTKGQALHYLKSQEGEASLPSTEEFKEDGGVKMATAGLVRDIKKTFLATNPTTGALEVVPVERDKVVCAYRYGTSRIPFGDADLEAMKFKPGPKCLSVLGFTKMKNIRREYLIGTGCHVVVPREGDTNSEVALSALVQGLKKADSAAIARKVYSDDRGLSLVALVPIMEKQEDEEGTTCLKQCLTMLELAYKENLCTPKKPSLEANLSEEEATAIDALIDSMDLMTADMDLDGEPKEAFEVNDLREFKNTYYQYSIVQKALFPNKKLPEELPARLKQPFELPASIRDKHHKCIEKLIKLFPIPVDEPTVGAARFKRGAGWTWRNEVNMEEDENVVLQEVTFPKPEIMAEDSPEEVDIKILFSDYCYPPVPALVRVVQTNLYVMKGDMEAVIECLKNCISERRKFAIGTDPQSYNDWIMTLVDCAPDHGKLHQFVQTSIKAELGLISKLESEKGATEEEVRKFQNLKEICYELELEEERVGPSTQQIDSALLEYF